VLHADETGIRIAKSLHWLHGLATEPLTWIGAHPRLGTEAFKSRTQLQQFKGVLVHDGWMPYKALACQHALCNTHHLRELTYPLEEHRQTWAEDMIERLTHANHQDTINYVQDKAPNYQAKKYQTQVNVLRDLYDAILAQGQIEHLRIGPTGKPGWPKQSKATNLTRGLVDCIEDVWRFITQASVPFTNNLAKQVVRMPKVKQRVWMCFRT
jgi:transposase